MRSEEKVKIACVSNQFLFLVKKQKHAINKHANFQQYGQLAVDNFTSKHGTHRIFALQPDNRCGAQV